MDSGSHTVCHVPRESPSERPGLSDSRLPRLRCYGRLRAKEVALTMKQCAYGVLVSPGTLNLQLSPAGSPGWGGYGYHTVMA